MMALGVRVSAQEIGAEMKRHRTVTPLKRPVHPGRTQKEAGFTPTEKGWLTIGVCRDLTCEVTRGERIANRVLAVLAVVLLLALGFGAVQGRWAEQKQVQTVEAGQSWRK